jgi:hypothetical protein
MNFTINGAVCPVRSIFWELVERFTFPDLVSTDPKRKSHKDEANSNEIPKIELKLMNLHFNR